MSLIIGLTGGIGSGKTTVAKMFEDLGIPSFIADDEAKKITALPEIKQRIIGLFGTEIITDKEIDRAKLAALVFSNKLHLEKLNNIIHPAVQQAFSIWCSANVRFKYVIYESAILLESQITGNFYKIITVSAPKAVRITRVMQRNNYSKTEVINRMSNQMTDLQREKKANFVISNLNLETTKEIVFSIYTDLMKVHQK